jgi:hypothetical protein
LEISPALSGQLKQSELGANEGDGRDDGGLGAEHARAQVRERESMRAKQSAFRGRPTALRAEGEDDRFVT